jgi:adenylyltransferase/sulfurtransferase
MEDPMIIMRRPAAITTAFDRQCLVPGWDQTRVEQARVLVAGVGALGNSVAAELVAHGVRRLALIDNDVIETSNLSRTVLFRPGDEGRRKCDVAGERLALRAPSGPLDLVPLHTDVVSELGWGVYRRVDLVLGCLDSSAARAGVGAPAWSLDVPAVFGGIYAWDGNVLVQGEACVACDFGNAEWTDMNRHYSCHRVRRDATGAPLPNLGLTASIVGALMAREALRLLHGDGSRRGSRTFLAGAGPSLHHLAVRRSPRCPMHMPVDGVVEMPELSSTLTAGASLERLARRWGGDVVLELGRDFLIAARCLGCGTERPLRRPRHRTWERDLLCEGCAAGGGSRGRDPDITAIQSVSLQTAPVILDRPLEALGIPPLHLLEVRTASGSRWIELGGDAERFLPGWPVIARLTTTTAQREEIA